MEILAKVKKGLESITSNEWKKLRKESENLPDWIFVDHWNNLKWYLRTDENDPYSFQKPTHKGSAPEVPASREIFAPNQASRFGLGNCIPVAYLAADSLVATVETVRPFREAKYLSMFAGDFSDYLDGQYDPDPRLFGHSRLFFLQKTTVLLDVRFLNSHLCHLLAEKGGWESPQLVFEQVIFNPNAACYSATQAISETAYRNGFSGILYSSVRRAKDHGTNGACLVLFDRNCLTPYSYPEWINRRGETEEKITEKYKKFASGSGQCAKL